MASESATINWNPHLNKSSAICRSAYCKNFREGCMCANFLGTDFHGSLSYSKNCPHTPLMCSPGCLGWAYFLCIVIIVNVFSSKYHMFDGFLYNIMHIFVKFDASKH